MKLDILAIGVHPDDVELCCSGTLLRHISHGQKAGILHLTEGELGTRGTGETRLQEAKAAAEILGVHVFETLDFQDGFFQNDNENRLKLIRFLRKYQPDILLTNALDDRHPDHGRAGWLSEEAAFLSGLAKIETEFEGVQQQAWRPKAVYQYIQFYYHQPDVVVDISPFWEKKIAAVKAYKSQFYNPDSKEPETVISSPEFLEFIKARATEFGLSIGVRYGEGFTARRTIGASSLSGLI